MEKEFKWDASPRGAFARFEEALSDVAGVLPPRKEIRITDRYLDNEKEDFSVRKIALRIRKQAGVFEATIKTRTALKNGLAERRERTLPLKGARSFGAALRGLEAKGHWEGLSLRGLKVRFTLRNRRRIYTVCFGSARCEAALDRYTVYAAERKQNRREIELELKSGGEEDFGRLIEKLRGRCGLHPVKISKVAGAEKLLTGKVSAN